MHTHLPRKTFQAIKNTNNNQSLFAGGKGVGASEGGIRVPLVVRWPGGGVPAGSTVQRPVSLLDFWPTVKEIIGEASATAEQKVH